MYPERSDRWLAEDLGVDNETVTSKREELEEKGELAETASSLGKDGKGRPRRQPKPSKTEAGFKPSPEVKPLETRISKYPAWLPG